MKCPVLLGEGAWVDDSVLICLTDAQRLGNQPIAPVVIGPRAVVRGRSVLYSGVSLAEGVIVDHFCVIRARSSVAAGARIMNFSDIGEDVVIGECCRVSGCVCSRAIIGPDTSTFGRIVHRYPSHGGGRTESSPIIGANVIIGENALIIGGISIGDNALIGAGAIVATDVLAGGRVMPIFWVQRPA